MTNDRRILAPDTFPPKGSGLVGLHSRAGGNPVTAVRSLDSRLRGNDGSGTSGALRSQASPLPPQGTLANPPLHIYTGYRRPIKNRKSRIKNPHLVAHLPRTAGLLAPVVVLLAANLALGLVSGDFGQSSIQFQEAKREFEQLEQSPDVTSSGVQAARQRIDDAAQRMAKQRNGFWPHIWLGIIAVLLTLLVNSISVTYFIGTSRWCSEVVDAYALDPSLAEQSRALKRRAFPWSLAGILVVLAIAALGAAADPYASTANPAVWVAPHWIAALTGVVVIGIAFLVQVAAVGANYEVICKILERVESIRAERAAAQTDAAQSDADPDQDVADSSSETA